MGIRKIAEIANVSTATVSRVLNNPDLVKKHTRDKVLRIAKELEYHKYNSSYTPNIIKKDEIAVIIPDILNTFFARILEGVVRQAKVLNLTVNLYLTHDDVENELDAIKTISQKQTRGVILIRSRNKEKESAKTIKQLNKYTIPFVLVDRDIKTSQNSGVFLSNANAVYDATNLLLNDSYKNIHIITGPKDSSNSNQRLGGFKESFLKHGMLASDEMIHTGDFTIESGLEITRKILSQGTLPDAILSIANQITVGCLKAISEKGLIVGKDIKLFSFNKLDASYINSFNISYIEHPVENMGEKSVTILNNMFVGTQGLIREIMDYKIHY